MRIQVIKSITFFATNHKELRCFHQRSRNAQNQTCSFKLRNQRSKLWLRHLRFFFSYVVRKNKGHFFKSRITKKVNWSRHFVNINKNYCHQRSTTTFALLRWTLRQSALSSKALFSKFWSCFVIWVSYFKRIIEFFLTFCSTTCANHFKNTITHFDFN